MHRWLFRLAGTFTALSVFVLGASAALADQTFRIEMGPGNAFAFAPTSFTVAVGEKITFNAVQGAGNQRPHDVAIEGPGGFKWELVDGMGNIAAGASQTGTTPAFTTAGEYTLYCPVGQHRAQGMVATIRVGAASGAASGAVLPRTGEPITLLGGALGGLGALSLVGGLFLRRRSS
jgi:LPXTG-motif cell wall-anchored protein